MDGSGTQGKFRTGTKRSFHFGFAAVLLALVIVGFAPTFYLDPMFETREDAYAMPHFLVFHAIVLTIWYVGLVVQSGLVVGRKLRLHRMLGVAGAIVAAAVIFTGAVATLDAIPRAADLGFPPRQLIDTLVTSNTANLILIAALVTAAIMNRTRPQVHKRLMLVASVAIIGPAVSPLRMFGAYLQSQIVGVTSIPVPLLFWVLLIGALAVHDAVTLGRVHRATLVGAVAKAAATIATISLVRSGRAHAYVDWLQGILCRRAAVRLPDEIAPHAGLTATSSRTWEDCAPPASA